ncbi:MAG: hypothetical protein JNK29_03465 [Anaerolineales bacterium]|nr:hypothetical protein [Anaerolineales bacterium]
MSQRSALLAAAGITAFVLVLIGGLVAQAALAAPPSSSPSAPSGPVPDPTAAGVPLSDGYPVTASLAATIAGNVAPGIRLLTAPELVDYQGSVAYEVATDRGLIYVDATTGQVLYNGAQAPARNWAGDDEHDDHEGSGHDDDND